MMKHQGKCVIFITGQMYNIEKNSQFYVLGKGFSNVYGVDYYFLYSQCILVFYKNF